MANRLAYSRHTFTREYQDTEGNSVLTERVPFRYREYQDNISHTCDDGESLTTIAYKYYKGLVREPQSPASLWWIIADFQPNPIIDPTVQLVAGQTLIIPSTRTVIEDIFSSGRQGESDFI